MIINYDINVGYKLHSSAIRVQPPVTFLIGDHVNVLHDYKKTGP